LPASTAVADGLAQHFVSGADISGEWWSLFHSPELTSLINAGLAHNPTLAAAQQTLIAAEENVRAEQGSFFPTISSNFQAERTKISAAALAGVGAAGAAATSTAVIPPYTLYNTSVSISYSPDVLGVLPDAHRQYRDGGGDRSLVPRADRCHQPDHRR
jgi:outer membrane protein TolC